jgi:PDZ domain
VSERRGTRQGYLLLADISGYTAFLTGTELEHAHGIVNELTTLIRSSRSSALFNVHPEIRKSYELSSTHGLFVASIETTAPLYEAGLREDDEILKIEGKPVGQVTAALQLLLHRRPGALPIEYSSHALSGLHENVNVIVKAAPAPRLGDHLGALSCVSGSGLG